MVILIQKKIKRTRTLSEDQKKVHIFWAKLIVIYDSRQPSGTEKDPKKGGKNRAVVFFENGSYRM